MRATLVAALTLGWVLGVGCDSAERPGASQPVVEPVVEQERHKPSGTFFSNELLAIHNFLEAEGKSFRFFHDSTEGKKYQWLITRSVSESGVHYHFDVGREINDAGTVIGGPCPVSDQFFSIRLDPETSKVEEMYGLGG